MQRYVNDVVTTIGAGSALKQLPAATCTVYETGTTTLATLYSDDGVTPQDNPFESTADGEVSFYAADGRYDLVVEKDGYNTVTISDILLQDLL